MKRIAVISLTERGRVLSAKICNALQQFEMQRYCFVRHTDENAVPFTDTAALTAEIFTEYDALVFICACGIAVRMIAPHLRSKQYDPAVLAVDDCGTFVIPLLSGHLGGANALAVKLAEHIGAQVVITTATDTGGRFSPDSFAAANHLLITDLNAAKQIAAAVLDGETIGLQSAYPYRNLPEELAVDANTTYGIAITDSAETQPFPVTLHLIPKNIVLGIGCKKGVSAEQITNTVRDVLHAHAVMTDRICKIASIDLKANEAGLLRFCADFHVPLQTYSADELMQLAGEFSHSDFAEAVTGADNICERSAVLCSGGELIIRKTAQNGVTVAAAAMPVEIDFEKRML